MQKFGSLIGIIVGLGAILAAQAMDHGSIAGLLNPTAIVLVVVGTLGATTASVGLDAMFGLGRSIMVALAKPVTIQLAVERDALVGYARKARREGLLKLDAALSDVTDEYLKRGLQMAIDGIDHDAIGDLLADERQSRYRSEAASAKVFEIAGGYSPTLGIIGTVVGLISVLSNIADVSRLAGSIATAFTATLWGVMLANIFWLPLGTRLKDMANDLKARRELQAAGIVGIALGESPAQIDRRLAAMLAGLPERKVKAKDEAPPEPQADPGEVAP